MLLLGHTATQILQTSHTCTACPSLFPSKPPSLWMHTLGYPNIQYDFIWRGQRGKEAVETWPALIYSKCLADDFTWCPEGPWKPKSEKLATLPLGQKMLHSSSQWHSSLLFLVVLFHLEFRSEPQVALKTQGCKGVTQQHYFVSY